MQVAVTSTLPSRPADDIDLVVRRYRELERDLFESLDTSLLDQLYTVSTPQWVSELTKQVTMLQEQEQFQIIDRIEAPNEGPVLELDEKSGTAIVGIVEEHTERIYGGGHEDTPISVVGPEHGVAGYQLIFENGQWLIDRAGFIPDP
jgi:hypothetical protein